MQEYEEFSHKPVLLREIIHQLNIQSSGVYIDATYGRGGHAGEILSRLGPDGVLLGIDQDPEAQRAARDKCEVDKRFQFEHGNFGMLAEIAKKKGFYGNVDGIILDLGVSSPQLDDPSRGFSFQRSGPLDMRMDSSQGVTAADWLNDAAEVEIKKVLWEFGEERFSGRIARAIVQAREKSPLTDTLQLAEVVAKANPSREKKHPATRTFQAIRIFINGELRQLEKCLQDSLHVLRVGGRILVISFHSLEDRIVKQFMRKQSTAQWPKDLPIREEQQVFPLRILGKAIRAGEEELALNPRSRSAILRIGERAS